MEKENRRQTKQKTAVYDVLMSTTSHPTADWVFQEVRKSLPQVSLGTIYRNLNQLVEDGLVVEILSERNISHYDANPAAHTHFICTLCDEISDLPLPKISMDLIREEGHRVDRTDLQFFGVCSKCLNQGG